MILRFSEEFHKCTNNLPELVIEEKTVGECLTRAFTVYPQLYVYLMDNKAEVALQSIFILNGVHIYDYEECKRVVGAEDVLELTMDVPSGESGALKYIAGALLIVVGALLWWTGTTPMWVSIGISMMIGGAISVLATGLMDAFGPNIGQPDAGGNLDNSSTYSFNGIRNTTVAGTPLQIVYGEFRVGGQFLNIHTTSTSETQATWDSTDDNPWQYMERSYEYLYAHIGLCEGEIEAVRDFRINKLPTNFYNAVEFVDDNGVVLPNNVRYGTANQTPMPKFNRVENTTSIGRKVLRPANLPAAPTGYGDWLDNPVPVYGYRDPSTNVLVYGYFVYRDGAYLPCAASNLAKVIVPWESRDPKLDLVATSWGNWTTFSLSQFNIRGDTWRHVYSRQLSLPVSYDGGGVTIVETQAEADGFTLTLSLPGLYAISKKDGYLPTTVSVAILYRLKSDPNWTISKYGLDIVISGKQRAEIIKSYLVEGLPLGVYEIAVIRNTEDHSGWANYVDDIYIKELSEYRSGDLSYPHTAQLGAVIRATDQLSGNLPAITSLVKGTKVSLPKDTYGHPITDFVDDPSVWSGEMTWDEETQTGTKYWSDNPIWCAYDLLTNRRYGLADYYRIDFNKLPIMRAKFFMEANYCNQWITDGVTGEPRKRFTLNLVIDQSKSASEWLGAIASSCRATGFYTEGIFWLDIDKPRPITQIFNMTNIKDYTQTGTSYRNIPNCYEVQFPNPEQDYEMDSYRVESKELQSRPYIEERKKALTFLGVTSLDQTKALTKYALVTGQYLTKFVTFKTGTDGLRCMVTDAIAIQHDVPQTGWGGKVLTVDYDSTAHLANLTLSSPFPYIDGMGSDVQITLQQDGEQPVTFPIATPVTDNTVTVYCSSVPTFIPAVGAGYVISLVTNGIDRYKVLSIKRDADEMCEITAVHYDEQIYTLADSTADIGIIVGSSTLPNPHRRSVTNTSASSKVYQDSTGSLKMGIEVFWNVPTGSSFWTGAVVNWALAGTFNYQALPVTTAGYAFIPDVGLAGNYQIVVTSIYKTGRQTINDALLDDLYRPYVTVEVTPNAPNGGFKGGVSGLEVIGSLDGTYTGKECRLRWRAPVVIDQYVLSETTAAATGNNTASWLAYYLVEIYNLDNSLRRVSRVNTEAFVYTHEMNHEDGKPVRSYNVVVTAVDRLGNSSTPVSLRVTNPVPTALV